MRNQLTQKVAETMLPEYLQKELSALDCNVAMTSQVSQLRSIMSREQRADSSAYSYRDPAKVRLPEKVIVWT